MHKGLIAALLLSGAAHAQTYDVDITLGNATYTGSLVISNGQLASADVIGNLGGPFTFGPGNDTFGSASNESAILFDSEYQTLSFTTSAPFGAPSMTVSDVVFNAQDGHAFGITECGATTIPAMNGNPNFAPCSGSLTATAAPELDSSVAITALTLLCGATLALKGRRARV